MEWVVFVLALALSGLVIGGLALLVPGPENMGVFATILAGLAGLSSMAWSGERCSGPPGE